MCPYSFLRSRFIVVLFFFLPSLNAHSEEAFNERDIFSLPFEQLLSINVVSKKDERVAQSPAVVSTYSVTQLERLGLSSLKEFLHFVTGIEVNEALTGRSYVQIRGLPGDSNQKVLFLLNGTPYWMPENGDIPLQGVPLAAIEKIEIIRGPGSVVYGTNASGGVISVVTKQGETQGNGVEVDMQVSSNESAMVSMYAFHAFNDRASMDVAAEFRSDDGYKYQVKNTYAVDPCFCFPETDNGENLRQEEHYSVLLNWRWAGLDIMAQSYREDFMSDSNGSLVTPTDNIYRGSLLRARYQKVFGRGSIEFFSDWNHFYRESNVENILGFFMIPGEGNIDFDNSGQANDRIRYGISSQLDVSQAVSWLGGFEYENRSTENQKYRDDVGGENLTLVTQPPYNLPFQIQGDGSILLIEASDTDELSAFLQADINIKKWRFVLGGRYVDNSEAGEDLSPRGSLVYELDSRKSLKLLYSEGFNSPTFSQSSATDFLGLPQDLDVSAEKIRTWDLAYSYISTDIFYVVNAFSTEAIDLITNFDNSEEVIRRSGVEFDLRYQKNVWNVYGGLSYLYQGDDASEDSAAGFTSRWVLKSGADLTLGNVELGASLRAASSRAEVNAYYLFNSHIRYRFSNGSYIYLTLKNLTDDLVLHPDVRIESRSEIQAAEPRSAVLGFHYRF